jgi:hypothetical protein
MGKYTVENSKFSITVDRNNTDKYTRLDNSVYFYAVEKNSLYKSAVGSLSADEAEILGNKLLEVAAEVRKVVEEAEKPKLPTERGLYINANADPFHAVIFRYHPTEGWTLKNGELFGEYDTVADWVTAIFKSHGLKRLTVED